MKNTFKKMLVALGVATLLAGCAANRPFVVNVNMDNHFEGKDFSGLSEKEVQEKVESILLTEFRGDSFWALTRGLIGSHELEGVAFRSAKIVQICRMDEGLPRAPLAKGELQKDGIYGSFAEVPVKRRVNKSKLVSGKAYGYFMTTQQFIKLYDDHPKDAASCYKALYDYVDKKQDPIFYANGAASALGKMFMADEPLYRDILAGKQVTVASKNGAVPKALVLAAEAETDPKAAAEKHNQNKPVETTQASNDEIGFDSDTLSDEELGFDTGSIADTTDKGFDTGSITGI